MQTAEMRGGGTGPAPARWAVPCVAAVVAVSPHWPGHPPGFAAVAAALLAGAACLLPPTGGARWFRFVGRRCAGSWRHPAADRKPPVVLPGPRPTARAAPGAAPPIDVLLHAGRMLAVVELRAAGVEGRPSPGLESLERLLVNAGVVVESIQWVQVSTCGRSRHPAGARWPATDRRLRDERTLVVLRIDPGGNERPIQARGGGALGARRLAAVTVARAVSLLAAAGARPRLLDGAATLRAMSEVEGTPTAARRGTFRVSDARPFELRDRLVLGGSQHRMWHWNGGSGPPDQRRFPSVAASNGVQPLAPAGRQPAQVVWSSWIRAGPEGVRRGGAVRLSADSVGELNELDRALHELLPPGSTSLGDAIDDQGPLFAATLLYGGPRWNHSPEAGFQQSARRL